MSHWTYGSSELRPGPGTQLGGDLSPARDEISFIFVWFALIFRVISSLGHIALDFGKAPLPSEIPSCAPAVPQKKHGICFHIAFLQKASKCVLIKIHKN